MPVDWKSPEAYTRLLAAMVAAADMKLDYRRIASMYGQGATYDSIEGRFRIIKREAAVLKAEIESGARPQAPPRGGPNSSFASNASNGSQTSTPKKAKTPATKKKDGVIGGRISKNGTPSKKAKAMKEEAGGENATVIKDEEPIIMAEGWANEELGWDNGGLMEA